jgi:isoleucyl-tRNA synthetase
MISMDLPSFKSCYMHGFVNDAQGRKMSKSLGNYILPQEVIEKYGADTLRYYSISGANPGLDLNYNFDDMKIKNRNLIVLWNLQKFLLDLADETGKNPANLKPALKKKYSIKENYIISRMNSAIASATEQFEAMKINEVPITAESLWLDLSRNYIKMIRDKASVGSEEDKEVVLSCVYEVLTNLLKIFAPIAPFITENIYQNLKQAFELKENSIHLLDWPKADKTKIDSALEASFEIISNVLQAGFSAREKAQLGLKWPVKEILIVSEGKEVLESARQLEEVLKEQLNVKQIRVQEKFPVITKSVKADFAKLKASFEPKTAAKIIAHFTTTSPETIIKHMEKEAKYVFKIDDNSYEITKEHVIMERTVPEGYIETEFRGGYVYLNKQRTPELEAEGFARELMRKIQSLRKDNLFDKKDRIALHVATDMADELKPFESMIKDKVGADRINISEAKAPKKFEFEKLETIKNKKFDICFGKI